MTALLYEQFIQNLGFTDVSSFTDGMSCLNALTNEPQIIFLDHDMGTMNGLEVLKKKKVKLNIGKEKRTSYLFLNWQSKLSIEIILKA